MQSTPEHPFWFREVNLSALEIKLQTSKSKLCAQKARKSPSNPRLSTSSAAGWVLVCSSLYLIRRNKPKVLAWQCYKLWHIAMNSRGTTKSRMESTWHSCAEGGFKAKGCIPLPLRGLCPLARMTLPHPLLHTDSHLFHWSACPWAHMCHRIM